MANLKETNDANNPSYYSTLALGIFICIIGVLIRFVQFSFVDIIANIILIAGIFTCLSAVNKILK